MADTVVSFPDLPEVEQKLPTGISSTPVVSESFISAVPIVPLSALSTHQAPASPSKFNLQLLGVGGDGFFSVVGNTKPFIDNFKAHGGRWDRDQFCWRFEAKYQNEVTTLVHNINSGAIIPEKFVAFKNKPRTVHQGSVIAPSATPVSATVTGSLADIFPVINRGVGNFQIITYEGVFLPKVGMSVTIRVGDKSESFPIVKVGTTGKNVDSAYITTPKGLSELVVVKGHWVIHGMLQKHSVHFNA